MRRGVVALAAAGLLTLASCSSPAAVVLRPGQTGYSGSLAGSSRRPVVRLGLMTSATDASGLVGLDMRFFQEDLGGAVTLQPSFYSTGAQEEEALLKGQLDAAYLDPVAAISAGQADGGSLIRIVSGAASGGSELIVRKTITTAAQLGTARLASPDTATQAAELRYWLYQHNMSLSGTSASVSGAQAVQEFAARQIAAAWEPPPYDTEMVADGGRILVNEQSQWPQGEFPSTVLVVTTRLLAQRPAEVAGLLKGQIQANQYLLSNKTQAAAIAANELAAALGTPVSAADLTTALSQVTFTNDPLAGTLLAEAQQAATVGLLKPTHSIQTLLDLTPLNRLLHAANQPPVAS
jgi:NitT/TauT family transport system substrate-binding protein